MADNLLDIRDAVEGDLAYIYNSWLADLRDADNTFLPNDVWFPAYRETIRRVLESPLTRVKVLCDAEAPDVLIGYIVADANFLHWIHIHRGPWRNRGLAKYLLNETKCSNLPLVWRTKLGHEKLTNPVKTRLARHVWWSTASPQNASRGLSSPSPSRTPNSAGI